MNNIKNIAKRFSPSVAKAILTCGLLAVGGSALAQSVEQVRWKSEEQVRATLGEPQSTTAPVGTHASYTLWNYPDFTVAFANQRAFHLFKRNSLEKVELVEDRQN